MRRRAKVAITAGTLLLALGTAQAAAPQVPSGTWAPAGDMTQSRWSAAAALLPDGRLLISGGFDGTGSLATAEIYASGGFTACGSMQIARGAHTAVTLADGRVLVAGGRTTRGGATATAESGNPSRGDPRRSACGAAGTRA